MNVFYLENSVWLVLSVFKRRSINLNKKHQDKKCSTLNSAQHTHTCEYIVPAWYDANEKPHVIFSRFMIFYDFQPSHILFYLCGRRLGKTYSQNELWFLFFIPFFSENSTKPCIKNIEKFQ